MSATSSVAAGNKDVLILDSLCEVCLFSSLVSPSLDVGQISSLFPAFQDFVIMCLAVSMRGLLFVLLLNWELSASMNQFWSLCQA